MSIYLDSMKKAITNYYDLRAAADTRVKNIVAEYGNEAGTKERERLNKQLALDREKAVSVINSAYNDAVNYVQKWGRPDGSQLTDDIKLFDLGIMTPGLFESLKEKYRSNATMSAALKAKGEALNAEARQAANNRGDIIADPYFTKDILSAEDKLNGYDTMKATALDTLDMIDGIGNYNDGWNKSLGKYLSEETIAHFGEGSGL